MNISEEMRKIMLAGIGAIATTAEKSQQLVEAFVKKGELTVEQGKVLNEELKRNIKESIHTAAGESTDEVLQQVEDMSPEQIEALKRKIAEVENQNHEGQQG